MVGTYFGKAISDSTESEYKNDPHSSNLVTSIRGRVIGMVETAKSETTGKHILRKNKTEKESKWGSQEKQKSPQSKSQNFESQLTGLSLQSDLHIEAYLSPSTDLKEFDMPPKLKLVTESKGETAWLKPNLLSGSSGNISLFEEDDNILIDKTDGNLSTGEGKGIVNYDSKDKPKNEPESLQFDCFHGTNLKTSLSTGISSNCEPSSKVAGSSEPPAYQPLDRDNNQVSYFDDFDKQETSHWKFPSQQILSAEFLKDDLLSKKNSIITGKIRVQNCTTTNDRVSSNNNPYFINEQIDRRNFSRNSKLRFPSNKGGYWSPLVKPLSEFMDNEFKTNKGAYSAQDEELIKQIDMLLLCDFSYKCINILMVALEIILFIIILTATILYLLEELPQDIELIHIMFFNMVMIFTLFALNSYASREVKIDGQCRVNSFLKIYWHLIRKSFDTSFKEKYMFLDDWYGDKKYRYIKAKLREVSIYGSASAIDLSYSYYRDIDSC